VTENKERKLDKIKMKDGNVFTVTLKEKLRAMNLIVTRNKAKLIARLNQADPKDG